MIVSLFDHSCISFVAHYVGGQQNLLNVSGDAPGKVNRAMWINYSLCPDYSKHTLKVGYVYMLYQILLSFICSPSLKVK
jgi:hypothetical protein